MIDMDIHDLNLQMAAEYEAMKLGHYLGEWQPKVIQYGPPRLDRKTVDTYVSVCKHCRGMVRVAHGLAEDVEMDARMTEACEINTGFEDRVMPFHDNTGCSKVIRFNRDTETVYLKECA